MTTGAEVRIGGTMVAGGWDGSDLAAVAGLSIRWGRQKPYDDPDPSVLTLQLIDRTGRFVSEHGRIGQEVTVSIADPPRVVFRGSIAKPKSRRMKMQSPLTGRPEAVWMVTLTASDPLAALGMAVYPGDAVDGMLEGAGGWSEVLPNVRLQRLFDAGANGLVDGFETVPDVPGTPEVGRQMRLQYAEDARTALELVQQVYRGVPLGVANYEPESNTVTLGQFADSSPVALTRVGGVVRLALTAGHAIHASNVQVSGYELQSEVDTAIDAVQVSYSWYGKDPTLTAGAQKRTIYTQGFIEGRTAGYNPRSRRVLKVDTQFMTFDPTEFVPGSRDRFNRFPAWLLERVVTLVNRLNGQLRMPTLTFDARRAPMPAEVEAIVYQPTVQVVPLYFVGSVFSGMPGVGPQFQIIGGTLTYQDGWTHEVTVVGIGRAAAATLTLDQLVSDPDVALGDFDPDLSLADLGHVTIGLPA